MATQLVNDKKQTESDPWSWPSAFTSDVQSWGRVHKSVHDSLAGIAAGSEAANTANITEVMAWLNASQKYTDLANPGLGFGMILDFGPFDALDQNGLVMETIASTKEGQRLLGILRSQLNIEGGEEVGGLDNEPAPQGDVKLFMGGAVVAALAYGAWWLNRRSRD